MYIDKKRIPEVFSSKDYLRGKEYYGRGQVRGIEVSTHGNDVRFDCVVEGSQSYRVSLRINRAGLENGVGVYCTCPRFAEKRSCKHLAAAMLACADFQEEKIPVRSDRQARAVLDAYLARTQAQSPPERLARLVPRMNFFSRDAGYPTLSFQVGYDRLYVVRDVKKFVNSVLRRETLSYGKGLTLCHAPEQFDPDSRELLSLLMDQFMSGRSLDQQEYYSDPYEAAVFINSYQKNLITLTGSAFDRFFDLLMRRNEPVSAGENETLTIFQEQDPEVSLSLERRDKAADLRITVGAEKEDWSFFGSAQTLYAKGPSRLFRCSGSFQDKVYPLLHTGAARMLLSLEDLPAFCGCVLPEIQEAVSLSDPAQLLQEYLPDECTPCFCFDIEGDVLTLRLDYRYGDVAFNCFEEPKKPVKRDLRAEQAALGLVERRFPQRVRKLYRLEGETEVLDFLTRELAGFYELGEVLVTDRLRDRRLQPTRPVVGMSVSQGLLTLDFSTGGFPPEELEALYQSLLKRRPYHKLKDGRYLSLDGSPCETLAEMAHMLQLSPKELAAGEVKLPAFRALYLDGLLSGSETVQVTRDRQFREMIRNFKSVPDGDYALPEGLENTLRPYQRVGFQWLKVLDRYGFGGILADEMGLGKTLQVIAYLSSLDSEPEKREGPSLVVCPASLILNWADELERFAPALRYALIMGTAGERARQIAQAGDRDVWVTSYELLRQDVERYASLKFTCCILDEAQHIKNQSTLISKAVKRIDCRQRFVLTGTPIENRLSELWNLFDFLMPWYLFTHGGFVEKLEKPAVKSGDQEAMDQLRRMVRPFLLRRMKKEVLKELPPKIEYVRRISLSEEERKVYFASSAAVRQSLAAEDKGKLAVLAALTQLRQICCAPDLCFENYEGPTSKLDACMELCAGMVENGHQVLLFSQFTSMLSRIRARLEEQKISCYTLEGSTPKEKRAQLVKSFNGGGASVFLISLKAGGTGLNLTAADVVIHYDPWWNLAAQDQATDRAHRIGQQSSVQVYKLIAKDTIEEKILELQSKKAALMDAVTDGSENGGILNMSTEDLLALFD